MSGAHIVAAGESLGSIAGQYGLTVADLVRWNDIDDPNLIKVGQKIELSGHEAEPDPPADVVHTVVAGDTVSQIAERYGKRWIDIAVANRLDDVDHIEVGQKLIIPAQGVAR
ncbi:MAG: LysM peptidoglycan-binding domain-containing protein [Terracoccus sp.]